MNSADSLESKDQTFDQAVTYADSQGLKNAQVSQVYRFTH